MLVLAAIAGFATALVVTRLVELVARRRSLLDVPNIRSSHAVPTPRVGGVGIVAGSLVGIVVGTGGVIDPDLAVLFVAGLMLAGVGLVDDLRHISVAAKQGAQLAAAAVAAWVVAPTLQLELGGLAVSIGGPLALALTVVWIVALVNAFNFIDGIDGMTGGLVVVTALIGLGLAAPGQQPVLIGMAAAAAGFLVWNFHPASVFMGDVGSQYLGYWMGVSLLVQADGTVDVIPLLMLLAPLLLDTGYTLVRRARSGANLFAAHRDHLYQRLVIAGVGQRSVSAGYAVATGACGLLALAYPALSVIGQVACLAAIVVGAVLFVRAVGRRESRAGTRLGDQAG